MAGPKPIQQIGNSKLPQIEVKQPTSILKPTSPATYDPGKQVAGYERRFEASGIDTDPRNRLEEFLNLPEKQNWFMDVLTLWDRVTTRPIANILDEIGRQENKAQDYLRSPEAFLDIYAAQGGDRKWTDNFKKWGSGLLDALTEIGKAGVEGVTGEREVSFDQALQTVFDADESNILTGSVGLFLEFFADPADWVRLGGKFMQATEVMSDARKFNDFLRTGDNAADLINQVGDIAKSTDDLLDIYNNGRKAIQLLKAGDSSAEVILAFNKFQDLMTTVTKGFDGFKNTKSLKSINEIVFGGIFKGFGKATKMSDNLLVRGLNIYDAAGGAADTYAKAKKGVAKMFSNLASVSQETLNKVRRSMGLENLAKKQMMIQWKQTAEPILQDIATRYNLDIDDVYEQALEYIEYFYNPKTSVGRAMRKSAGQPIDEPTAEIVRVVLRNPIFNDDLIAGKLPDVDKVWETTFESLRTRAAEELTRKANQTFDDTIDMLSPGDELEEIVKSPRKKAAQEPLSIGEEIEKIVKSPRKAQAAQNVRRYTLEQQQEMLVLSNRLKKAKTVEEFESIVKEAIQKGYIDNVSSMEDSLRNLFTDRDLFNANQQNKLFNAIYEEVDIEGIKGFRVKDKKLLEQVLSQVEKEYKFLLDTGYLETLDQLLETGRFAQNSDMEQVLRKLFGTGKRNGINLLNNLDETSPLFGMKFEDLFVKRGGNWVLKDPNMKQEIADVLFFYDRFEEVINAPRFISDLERSQAEEILKLEYADELKLFGDEYAKLSQINDEIFGIDLSSKLPEGWVRHSKNSDIPVRARNKVPDGFRKTEDTISFSGNVKTIDSREYQMTVKEANRLARWEAGEMLKNPKLTDAEREFWEARETIDLFSSSIKDSVLDIIQYQPELASASRKFDDMLVRAALNNEGVYRVLGPEGVLENGRKVRAGDVTADGYRIITVGDVRKKLQSLSNVLDDPESFKEFTKKFLTDANGRPLADGTLSMIDVNVFEMIGRDWKKVGSEMGDTLLKFIDFSNNAFKRFKVLSVGMHLRNIAGNFTNMVIAGMPINEILKNTVEAHRVLKNGDKILQKAMLGGLETLSKQERRIYDFYVQFLSSNFDTAAVGLQELDQTLELIKKGGQDEALWKRTIDWVTEKNAWANTAVDSRYRMAMLIYATENPEFYLRKGLSAPSDAVRQALFDPNDLTGFERSWMKRVMPFYTFTKKNLAHQFRSFAENSSIYRGTLRVVNATWDLQGIDRFEIEDYKREQMWVPVPGLTDGNKYVALKLNLPMEELSETIAGPMSALRKLLATTAPAVRAPFEVALNQQVFTGRPVQEFEGQRSYIFQDVPLLENIPRGMDYFLSQIGIDVPLAPAISIVAGVNRLVKGESENFPAELLTGVLRSAVSEGDLEQARISRDYDKLDELQDMVRYYKDRGVQIKTIPEIENENKVLMELDRRIKQFTGGQGEVFTPPRK